MAEMLYLEAPVSEIEWCHACHASQGQYRCVSCFDGRMLCARCIVNDHHAMPFHKVEVRRDFCRVYTYKPFSGMDGYLLQKNDSC